MRPPIYKPNGAAAEYGDWALNIYDGCPHACPYCYVPLAMHKDRATFHAHCAPCPGIVEETRKQLEKTGMTGQTVHLCFSCDPFPTGYDCTPTLDIIRLLKEHGNNVQILTKGDGSPCLDLLDGGDWYGVTIDGSETGEQWAKRTWGFTEAKVRGIKTWVSFEPVLYPDNVLSSIRIMGADCDKVKIGKLNYNTPPVPINWADFGRAAEALCQSMGLDYYIKDSLRKEMERHGN
ncbi:MAG: radical SAM protein [Abditibacteriota bacterium]|nr:radical SAM protein [Abditibacteriota bacterium]